MFSLQFTLPVFPAENEKAEKASYTSFTYSSLTQRSSLQMAFGVQTEKLLQLLCVSFLKTNKHLLFKFLLKIKSVGSSYRHHYEDNKQQQKSRASH